jgi:hypothetical protein
MIPHLSDKGYTFGKSSGAIAQSLPVSIENYLKEAIAYLVARSRCGVTLKPIADFSPTVGKSSSAIALALAWRKPNGTCGSSPSKNLPVNNPVICNESAQEKLFVSLTSMTHHQKFTSGKFVEWVSEMRNPPLLSHSEGN